MKREQDELHEMSRIADQVASWRAKRPKVGPMPEFLWEAAVALAELHGLGPTSRGLKVDFGGLQRRLKRAKERRAAASIKPRDQPVDASLCRAEPAPLQFIELPISRLPGPPSRSETMVEVSHPKGATLTVRLDTDGAFDLPKVVESFLRGSQCSS